MPATETRRTLIATTERLLITRFTLDDAPFILRLLNEPLWLRYIGDKGVHTLDDARDYLRSGPLASYAEHGFGLYRVALRKNGTALGLCGLIKRPALQEVDLGFAFLQNVHGQGFAREAAQAVLEHARSDLALERIVAITTPDNLRSQSLLLKLGFQQNGMIRLEEGGEELAFFERVLDEP